MCDELDQSSYKHSGGASSSGIGGELGCVCWGGGNLWGLVGEQRHAVCGCGVERTGVSPRGGGGGASKLGWAILTLEQLTGKMVVQGACLCMGVMVVVCVGVCGGGGGEI